MRWGMANAEYGSDEHAKLMRDGWEPLSVVTIPIPGALAGQMRMGLLAFLKKEVTDEPATDERKDAGGISLSVQG